jgi:hypothetical protein
VGKLGATDKLKKNETELSSEFEDDFEQLDKIDYPETGEFELLNTCDVVKDMESDEKARKLIPQLIAEAGQIEAEGKNEELLDSSVYPLEKYNKLLEKLIQINIKLESAAMLCKKILMSDKAVDLRAKIASLYADNGYKCHVCLSIIPEGFLKEQPYLKEQSNREGLFMDDLFLTLKLMLIAVCNIANEKYEELAAESVGPKKTNFRLMAFKARDTANSARRAIRSKILEKHSLKWYSEKEEVFTAEIERFKGELTSKVKEGVPQTNLE